jgi:hypothetical protein
MERSIAANLIEEIQKCYRALDQAELIAREIPDAKEQEWTRRQIAEAIGNLVEVTLEIGRTYPDLNPHHTRENK